MIFWLTPLALLPLSLCSIRSWWLFEMIKIQGALNRELWIGCSGGVDSMAVADFLGRSHKTNLLFFDHGTETSLEARTFLEDYVPGGSLSVGELNRGKYKDESWEEYWRNQRYEWFQSFSLPVITCHHLDDVVETWIWSSMHGQGKITPYSNRNVIRPFRLNRKETFTNWCRNKNVPWIEDASNDDTKFMRNYIRKELVDKCLVVNPGLHKVIAKKVQNEVHDNR